MRLPYSWLREVVQRGAPDWDVTPPHDLEQALIRVGHEVEDIITLGPVTGPLTVGRVTAIEELTEFKKPIRACKVDVVRARIVTSFAVQRTSWSVTWLWWRCPAPPCLVTSTSPAARRMAGCRMA